jgi:polar amino acid transport system substrate-binding protein
MLTAHPRRFGALLASLVAMLIAVTDAAGQPTSSAEQKAQIAPTGTLRAALVKIPFLAKQDAAGTLKGVAPDLAEEMARRLGVSYQPMAFDSPNAGIKALREGAADVTFLAPTPERVGLIDFGPAFMEMEMTLLVPGGSPIQSHADADQPGKRIVAYERTAVDEMLVRKMTRATIVRVPIFGYRQAFELLKAGQADAFADLRDALMAYQPELPDSRIVPGNYGSNALAIGFVKDRPLAAAYVKEFTEAAIASGLVTRSIAQAGIRGAAPPAR